MVCCHCAPGGIRTLDPRFRSAPIMPLLSVISQYLLFPQKPILRSMLTNGDIKRIATE